MPSTSRVILAYDPVERTTSSGRLSRPPAEYICLEGPPPSKKRTRKPAKCPSPEPSQPTVSVAATPVVDPVEARLLELALMRLASRNVASTSASTSAPVYTRTNPNPKSIAPACNTDAERWPAWYLDPTIPWGGVVPKEEPDVVID